MSGFLCVVFCLWPGGFSIVVFQALSYIIPYRHAFCYILLVWFGAEVFFAMLCYLPMEGLSARLNCPLLLNSLFSADHLFSLLFWAIMWYVF